jgi:uncharacterized membrane protein
LAARRVPSGPNRNILSLMVMGLGALLLLIVPLLLFVFALSQSKTFQLPGTLMILSVVSGMALVIIGAALHD